jgi:TonB-linked SusC/RagA family outer membrane protein
VLIPVGASAQGTGTITGSVIDQSTQQPLSGVQIFVANTQLGSLTDAQGRYLIPNVPAGAREVRANLIGYSRGVQQVTVAAGASVTVNFALEQSAIELAGVIVTATGEERRTREIGNAVGQIDLDEVELAAVNDVSQVLTGRTAGVSVLQAGGTTGTGARVRIRGSNSVSLSNNPLLIVDGVRADFSSTQSIGVGGQDTNRLNDINPEDIESIEILKGPAAAALYGTAAANGVIQITTKKGVAGDTRYRVYTEQGQIYEVGDYPANYTALDSDGNSCLIALSDPGECTPQFFNPLEDSRTTPFQDGSRQKYGISASGGSEQTTYFLSADVDREDGIYKFDASNLDRVSFRANVRGQLQDNFDVTVNTGYTNSDLRLPQNDNNILGIVSGGLLSFATEFDEVEDADTCGFLVQCPEGLAKIDTKQNVERITGSATANFRPMSWLSFVGTAGLDRVGRHDSETIPPGEVFFGSLPEGERTSNRIEVSNYTANLGATANYELTPSIFGETSIGTQYSEELFRGTFAFGARLLAGAPSLGATTTRFSVDEATTQVRTIGAYVQQQLAFNDRIYLTGALRADDNSAFGNDFGLAYYPSLSASWVVAEEAWFPQTNLLSTLRLRSAYGRSGLRPGQLDAFQFLSPVAVTTAGGSVPGFTFGGTGNVDLEPEKSTEVEVGFDAGFFSDRIGTELTYYNKKSEDALISRRLPPSVGVSSSRFENLGEVRNSGLELLVNAQVLNMPQVRWNSGITGSWTENELVEIGTDPATGEPIPEIIFGLGLNSQRHAEGLPLGGYYGVEYTFDDENDDGLIQPGEIELADSASFLGNIFPTTELSFNTDATFFDIVKLSGLLDYRGGHKQFNSTEEFRCGAFFTCQGLFDETVSLEDQAAAVAAGFFGSHAGYIEDASFVKLRELALTLMVPTDMANRFGAGDMSLTFAGRNLKTWTDYSGLDPEINYAGSGSNFSTAEFLTQPPVRYFTVRLDVSF